MCNIIIDCHLHTFMLKGFVEFIYWKYKCVPNKYAVTSLLAQVQFYTFQSKHNAFDPILNKLNQKHNI